MDFSKATRRSLIFSVLLFSICLLFTNFAYAEPWSYKPSDAKWRMDADWVFLKPDENGLDVWLSLLNFMGMTMAPNFVENLKCAVTDDSNVINPFAMEDKGKGLVELLKAKGVELYHESVKAWTDKERLKRFREKCFSEELAGILSDADTKAFSRGLLSRMSLCGHVVVWNEDYNPVIVKVKETGDCGGDPDRACLEIKEFGKIYDVSFADFVKNMLEDNERGYRDMDFFYLIPSDKVVGTRSIFRDGARERTVGLSSAFEAFSEPWEISAEDQASAGPFLKEELKRRLLYGPCVILKGGESFAVLKDDENFVIVTGKGKSRLHRGAREKNFFRRRADASN